MRYSSDLVLYNITTLGHVQIRYMNFVALNRPHKFRETQVNATKPACMMPRIGQRASTRSVEFYRAAVRVFLSPEITYRIT
jgi:hypothetical protein